MSQQRDQLLASAAAAQRAGNFESANSLADQALLLDPTNLSGLFLAGVASARLGQILRAEQMFCRLLKVEPRAYEGLISLSTLYREGGRLVDSIELAQRAVAVKPSEAQAFNNLGLSLLAIRRLSDASRAFVQALSLRPNFASAHYNLGKTKQLEGRDGEAARAFYDAASINPSVEHLVALGQMLLTLCDYEAAIDCARRFVTLHPNSAAAHLLLCGALTEVGEFQAAESHLAIAESLDPDRREALHFAARQRPLGHIREANENLRKAIKQNPYQVPAYDALVQNERITEPDRSLVDQMRDLLTVADLSPTERVSLNYGLGKAFDDLREYQAAMAHYDEANRLTRLLKFGDKPFDELQYRGHVDKMIALVQAEVSDPRSSVDSDLPILIVGMMRSGTTLVEQILSSHRDVAPAGEQLFWTQNWSRFASDKATIAELGREYVDSLHRFGVGSRHVTDKMPGNYMFAGLIHEATPNARFIHVRRNPVDTCVSIWATPNHMPHEGGNQKSDIAFVYRQYLRMMEHWRRTLPADRLLEIDYEDLVSAPERITRQMLEFIGLDWDQACLRPHDNKRLVATPSAWQVRQPVYGSSVERWRRFEPWLGEFSQLLNVTHERLPSNSEG